MLRQMLKLSMVYWTALGNLCEISQGAALARLKDELGNAYRIVQASDLENLSLDSFLTMQNLNREKTPTVKDGDVLFSLRGSPIRAVVAPDGASRSDLVASPNLAIIRPKPPTQVDPIDAVGAEYLACLLTSAYMVRDLFALSGGGSIFTISVQNLRELEVPVPPAKVQYRIGKAHAARHQLVVAAARVAELQADRLNGELELHLGFKHD